MATPAIPADPPLEQLQALIAQVDQGRCAEMVTEAERLIQDYSSSFMLWTLLGVGNTQLHKPDRAIAAYQRACSINPAFADGHYNIGVLLQEQGRLDDAAAAYQRAVTLEPGHADAHNSLGFVLREQGQFAAAVVSLQRALALRPDFAEAHYNLGIVLKAQGRLDAAVAAYHRCLALKPDFAEAHTNLGVALRDQGKLDEAIASYRRALAVRPDHARVEAELLHQLLHICDWQNYDSLPTTCARLAAHRDAPATFSFFAMVDDPAIQLQFSRKWAAARFRLPRGTVPAAPKTRPQRLRIGYFSADFYDHATLFLMAGLLR